MILCSLSISMLRKKVDAVAKFDVYASIKFLDLNFVLMQFSFIICIIN